MKRGRNLRLFVGVLDIFLVILLLALLLWQVAFRVTPAKICAEYGQEIYQHDLEAMQPLDLQKIINPELVKKITVYNNDRSIAPPGAQAALTREEIDAFCEAVGGYVGHPYKQGKLIWPVMCEPISGTIDVEITLTDQTPLILLFMIGNRETGGISALYLNAGSLEELQNHPASDDFKRALFSGRLSNEGKFVAFEIENYMDAIDVILPILQSCPSPDPPPNESKPDIPCSRPAEFADDSP